MTDFLMIDKPESRLRVEWEGDQLKEYYFYDKQSNKVYTLEESTISFLQMIRPEEDKEKKISYKQKEEILVFDIEVWKDVVDSCLEQVKITNTEIVKLVRSHSGTRKERKESVDA